MIITCNNCKYRYLFHYEFCPRCGEPRPGAKVIVKGLVPIFLLATMECKEIDLSKCKPGDAGYYATLAQCITARNALPPNITQAQCKHMWGDPK